MSCFDCLPVFSHIRLKDSVNMRPDRLFIRGPVFIQNVALGKPDETKRVSVSTKSENELRTFWPSP